ncbi:MAG: hypothetical protein AB2L07_09255 [Thermoanaerobaculaceae bacterium]
MGAQNVNRSLALARIARIGPEVRGWWPSSCAEDALRVVAAAALALLASASTNAQTLAPDPGVVQAEHLGRAIHRYDEAAWLATDALASLLGTHSPPVDGWIAADAGLGVLVRFVKSSAEGPCAAFDSVVERGQASIKRNQPCQALSPLQAAMFRARATAAAQLDEPCSDAYNTVVLPGEVIKKQGWLVYLLAATTEPGAIPIGGHYRIHVSMDGRTVVEKTRLSKGCGLLRPPPPHPGVELGSPVVTQVLTDYPIETHVFLSLSHHLPLLVVTERGVWQVADGAIQFLRSAQECARKPGS